MLISSIYFKAILDLREFFEFYLPNADLFHDTLEQEIEEVKDSHLKFYFVTDLNNRIVGCFAFNDKSIGYFVLLDRSEKNLNELIAFWKTNIKESINLSTSSRYLQNFLDIGFILKYSRNRMELDLENFDSTHCTFNNLSSKVQEIPIDSLSTIESIVKLIFEANEGTMDQKVFNAYTLDLEQETKLLHDIFNGLNREYTLIKEASLCIKDSNSKLIGVILVTDYLGTPLIYDFAISKNFQGKKLGSNLICSSIKALQSSSYTKLALYVTKGNSNAEHIYTKLQFKPEEFNFCQLELNT